MPLQYFDTNPQDQYLLRPFEDVVENCSQIFVVLLGRVRETYYQFY